MPLDLIVVQYVPGVYEAGSAKGTVAETSISDCVCNVQCPRRVNEQFSILKSWNIPVRKVELPYLVPYEYEREKNDGHLYRTVCAFFQFRHAKSLKWRA